MTDTWLIVGASSAMARALARRLSERGAHLILAGRDEADLAILAADCRIRGAAGARALPLDLRASDAADRAHAALSAAEGRLNVAVFAGSMPPQDSIDADPALIDGVTADSFLGPARLLHRIAPLLAGRGAGIVVGVGSVAGDRGRVGNYVYGAAKAGFHAYLSGLRNRLARNGVHVITVKPGFVDTQMTWGLPGLFLVAPPDAVAGAILSAAAARRDVIYVPGFWRWIMLIIRAVPERVFKRMKI